MSAQFQNSQIALNCGQMLRKSIKYRKDWNRSCDIGQRRELKNWIQINKKQFLIKKPKEHQRSHSLQQRSSSEIKKLQIYFPGRKGSKITRQTRCNSTETSSSVESHQPKLPKCNPNKEILKPNRTNTSILFFIMNQENGKIQNINRIKGLNQSKISDLFRKGAMDQNAMVVRGKGIL